MVWCSPPGPPGRRRRWFPAVLAVLLLGLWAAPARAQERPSVVIFKEDIAPYHAATEAVMAGMRAEGLNPDFHEVVLDRRGAEPERAIDTIRGFKPAVVVSIGTAATQMAARELPNTPVVFALVLNPVQSGILKDMQRPGGHVTGAAMDIPFERQFETYRRIAPDAERLGVLSNPAETGLVVRQARPVAQRYGFTLVVEEVESNSAVPEALRRLLGRDIDGLWTVADSTVFTRSSTQLILRESTRARIPTMGLSTPYCKVGFIFCLSVDSAENGRQAGQLAARVARGADPATLPVALPEHLQLALNLRIAESIGRGLPPDLVERATVVFE